MPRPRRPENLRLDLRLDEETAKDLRALEGYLRAGPSAVVRQAIAALARACGLRQNGNGADAATPHRVAESGEAGSGGNRPHAAEAIGG